LRIELQLDFRNGEWEIEINKERISAPTIGELKEKLFHYFLKRRLKGKIEVYVTYDWKKLPQWLWQYQNYYFERVWIFEI